MHNINNIGIDVIEQVIAVSFEQVDFFDRIQSEPNISKQFTAYGRSGFNLEIAIVNWKFYCVFVYCDNDSPFWTI